METLTIREMQNRVTAIVAKAGDIREAIARAGADETVTTLCREIITDAVILAWGERRDAEIDTLLSLTRSSQAGR